MIALAWESVKGETISNCFVKQTNEGDSVGHDQVDPLSDVPIPDNMTREDLDPHLDFHMKKTDNGNFDRQGHCRRSACKTCKID